MSSEQPEVLEDLTPPASSPASRVESAFAARARTSIQDPNKAITIFWAAGTFTLASALLVRHWPPRSFLAFVILVVLASTAFAIRILAGGRLPQWTLNLDIGMATALVSASTALGVAGHVDFATLYIWVALYTGLYFRPAAVAAHVGGAGAAYALVLVLDD